MNIRIGTGGVYRLGVLANSQDFQFVKRQPVREGRHQSFVLCFQVAQQAVKGSLVGVVFLPLTKVADVPAAAYAPGPADLGPHHRLVQSDRE